jgi:serine/threonine-protein kinase
MKPDNIFLIADPALPTGERVKVLDFGIAKFTAESGGKKTTVGLVLGTPQYMSPEQCDGREKLSDRVDVYSLGVIFYELLAGVPPFRSDSSAVLLRQHIVRPPPPLADRAPHASRELHALVHEMLAKEAGERPSMVEVAARLEGTPSHATSVVRALRWMRRYRLAALVAAMALLGGVAFWRAKRARHAAEVSPSVQRLDSPTPAAPPAPPAALESAPLPPLAPVDAPRPAAGQRKQLARPITKPRPKISDARQPSVPPVPPVTAPAPASRKPSPITNSDIEPDR